MPQVIDLFLKRDNCCLFANWAATRVLISQKFQNYYDEPSLITPGMAMSLLKITYVSVLDKEIKVIYRDKLALYIGL